MSSTNVNFPENLNISPSAYPDRELNSVSGARREHSVFGDVAQREAIEKYGIAGRIWEAAYFLSRYIDPPSNVIFDPPFIGTSTISCRNLVILELGSGAGMTSSCIAEILNEQDMLIATDLPDVCPLLESNIRVSTTSAVSSVYVRPLAWGNEVHSAAIASELLTFPEGSVPLTHVVCSDLIYFPELLAPLLRTLLQVTSPPFSPSTTNATVNVVISYKLRSLSKETPFWSAFGLWFNFEPILVKDTSSADSQWQRFGASAVYDPVFIFVGCRRPESFSWTIPLDDSDLLGGKGAMGNDSMKSDDTFETLLFMTMDDMNT
ncbi:hypothetical protein H2248_008556 [Termitomyces sp. 'cryptogamus']|nr:hypothetical protein H2248_008556 [Termitomyces sp. 'cryptogamus']